MASENLYSSFFERCPPEWDVVSLPSAIDFREGPGILAKDFRETGIPLLRLSSIERPFADLSGCDFLDPSMVERKWSHFAVEPGDLLISTSGTLGRVSIATETVKGAIPYTGIIRMRPANKAVTSGFLRYFLTSPLFALQATASAAGSVLKHFGPSHLRQMSVPIPTLLEQDAIAAILSSLDDKIEQNRRTSRALEELARGMFKAWFVDFEPVKAKAAGQKSYPGMPAAAFAELPATFTDSELGPVPEGWERRNVADLEAESILLIGDGYRAKRSELAEEGTPFIRAGNVDGIVDTREAELLGDEATSKAGVKVSQVWDTVFTSKGTVGRLGIVTPYTGRVVYAPQVCFWRALNTEQLNPFMLHLWMKSDLFTAQWMGVKGQTDMADFVSLSDQRAMNVLVPTVGIQRQFAIVAEPLIQLQSRLEDESRRLAAVRDYLLPKLLSGEVRVAEAERAV